MTIKELKEIVNTLEIENNHYDYTLIESHIEGKTYIGYELEPIKKEEDQKMISGTDITKTLDLFPDEELDEIQNYINDLKSKRKKKKEEEYLNELKTLLDKASKDNIYFCLDVDGAGFDYPSIHSEYIEIE